MQLLLTNQLRLGIKFKNKRGSLYQPQYHCYLNCYKSRKQYLNIWKAVSEDVQFDDEDVDIEAQAEEFMKQQAQLESGQETAFKPDEVIGSELVDEDTAKLYCREIMETIQILKDKRDMDFNELKLIMAIEDPRVKENRQLGVENESGVSRDEMMFALTDVGNGKIPKDRIALRELHKEIINWPSLADVETVQQQPEELEGRISSTANRTRQR
eukprot:TRINITY_DN5147_c0_g1_i4.p1 TRINITY_DN5147_c0_g1~~TRINITY_DN5147_c0_g1_i4.p1  ORF type:complete len:247 (+),score=34.02 TRINITY_DN5147_c0_g1_i4:104-742(+)